jgi:galactose-1-phosphate uridylyltransferase
MSHHNSPFKLDQTELWHYHIEIYTPYRGKDRWKFLGGVESGTNTFINDSLPEQNAAIFRNLKV